MRVERPAASTLIDTGGVDFLDADPIAGSIQRPGAQAALNDAVAAMLVVDARAGTPARRRGAGRSCCARLEAPVVVAANKVDTRRATSRSPPTSTPSAWASPLAGVRRPGPGHRRPARPRRRAAARGGATCPRRTRTPSAWRSSGARTSASRRSVNRAAGRRARDRLRGRRHHARRDRPAARGRRAQAGHRRHRRPAPPGQGHRARSSTTRRCAPSARPSAPTSRSSSATRTTASPAQDLRIAELAMQAGCATALVLNKWDVGGEPGPWTRRDARSRARAGRPRSCGCARRC